jgi:hypothetical protein
MQKFHYVSLIHYEDRTINCITNKKINNQTKNKKQKTKKNKEKKYTKKKRSKKILKRKKNRKYILSIHKIIWIYIISLKKLGLNRVVHFRYLCKNVSWFHQYVQIIPTAAGSKKKPKNSCSIGSCVAAGGTVAANDYN